MKDHFVVLGVAPVRREWFGHVSRWANEAALPIEFIKCISVDEVLSRLDSGRPFSAVLIDASANGVDRDLLDHASSVSASPIIIDHGLVDRDWGELGARAVLSEQFNRMDLSSALEAYASPIGRGQVASAPTTEANTHHDLGRVIAVTGAGGVGSSTVAMALSQGLATQSTHQPLALVDMALRSSQAMLHDTRDVVPGLLEFVESHRLGVPNEAEAMRTIHSFPERGYDLLLGLRHERDWASIPARALSAGWTTLMNRYQTTVCDVTGDLDGIDETGSADIEDRNRLARMAVRQGDLVVVVGRAGSWGIHHVIRTVLSLSEIGVPADRIVPVINHAPRNPRAKAEITAAVAELLGARMSAADSVVPPVFVPYRKTLEAHLGTGEPLPSSMTAPLASTVGALLERTGPLRDFAIPNDIDAMSEPVAVTPGSLGSWSDIDD